MKEKIHEIRSIWNTMNVDIGRFYTRGRIIRPDG